MNDLFRQVYMESFEFQIIVDNTAADPLLADHGFALLVRHAGGTLLFDTGQSALVANCRALGVDLGAVDSLVLSHGHYDHTGGVALFLADNNRARVYAHKQILAGHHSFKNGQNRYIGMTEADIAAMDALPPARLKLIEGSHPLGGTMGLISDIPRLHAMENTGGQFYLDAQASLEDVIADEVVLWLRTARGLVIVTGCCHSGLINTVNHVLRETGERKLCAVIGGLHMEKASEGRIVETAARLKAAGIERLVHCHCTGARATGMFRELLGDIVMPGEAGMCFAV